MLLEGSGVTPRGLPAMLASASSDGTVKLWDVRMLPESGWVPRALPPAAFGPHGLRLLSRSPELAIWMGLGRLGETGREGRRRDYMGRHGTGWDGMEWDGARRR